MRSKRIAALAAILVLSTAPALAQWGNPTAQEKGDILGRDLAIPPIQFFGHTAIFSDYASGDPADRSNSDVIEMMGPEFYPPSTGGMETNTVQNFIDRSLFRGAFRYLTFELTWQERRDIVEAITAMKNRSTPIDYVSPPYYNKYLTWTNRDGNAQVLTLSDIDRMRSDAVVEFAYASQGFPIFRPNLFNTIINSPDLFQAIASSNALVYPTAGLIPVDQLYFMLPAIADPPEMTVYDANNVPIAPGGASSMTVITVNVSDELSGPGGLELIQNGSVIAANYFDWDDTEHTYTSANISELGDLEDGQYTLRAVDQASNYTSATFDVDSGSIACILRDTVGNLLGSAFVSTHSAVAVCSDFDAGVCSISITNSSSQTIGTADFQRSSVAILGPFTNLASDTYTLTAVDCATNVAASTFSVIASSTGLARICLYDDRGNSSCSSSVLIDTTTANRTYLDIQYKPYATCSSLPGDCDAICAQIIPDSYLGLYPGNRTTCAFIDPPFEPPFVFDLFVSVPINNGRGFSIGNLAAPSTVGVDTIFRVFWSSFTDQHGGQGNQHTYIGPAAFGYTPDGYKVISASITIPQTGKAIEIVSGDSNAVLKSYFSGVAVSSQAPTSPMRQSQLWSVFGQIGSAYALNGSDFIYTATTTLLFSSASISGISVDTMTVSMYRWSELGWSSSSIANQYVNVSSLAVVTASGTITQSGVFALFYAGHDSSSPVTTLGFTQSTFSFSGATFVSTYTYVILTATDPVVNGYASTVASVTYRIDPTLNSPFLIYSSSIPLPRGTHVLEYRSIDYAGNAEAIQTATFTVTPGTAFRGTNTAQVNGVLLNGYLGSGAKLEIESAAQNLLTLMISSVNRQGMVAVDNIGEVGIGVTPQANLNIGAAAIGLQLRSGNSTSAVTSNQIAFGYNGDYSMRHLLRTEHSTATHGNKMDFLVWNTGAASTMTVASLNVLSLQGMTTGSGGSFHVQPVGEPDAEVEVSNGLVTGGGTMQRLQVVSPSSRRFKTDIKDLNKKAEAQALDDVAGLRHAAFRYKSRQKNGNLVMDPTQPLRTGLIYEDAPESIRDGEEALSTTERMVNVEMALKASMRRLEELQNRYHQLKARKRSP